MELLIQYSTSTAFASSVIRRLTHSPFSHTDIVITPEVAARFNVSPGLLGASGPDATTERCLAYRRRRGKSADPGGVLIRSMHPWAYKFPPLTARIRCSDKVHDDTIAFALSQLKKPFDKIALHAFLRDRAGLSILHRDWRDPAAWFCAELILRAPEVGGLFPYELIVTKDVVSPNDTLLIFNPFIINAEEFAEAVAIVGAKAPPAAAITEKT